MRKKRHTIVHRVFAILTFALAVSFGAGTLIIRQLEQSNMNYIYRLTKELVNTSIAQMESEFARIRSDIYDIVVSDAIQKAGSVLLSARDGGDTSSGMARSSSMSAVINGIQEGISANHSIVCANFLDFDGNLQVIASTRYYKLSEEAARQVEQAAIEAKGDTVFLGGAALNEDGDILIAAKQLREKKNLSFKHIGVVVLIIDVNRLGTLLTDTHDGIYVVQNTEGTIRYILNDENGLLSGEEQRNGGFALGKEQASGRVFDSENWGHSLFYRGLREKKPAVFLSGADAVYGAVCRCEGYIPNLYGNFSSVQSVRLYYFVCFCPSNYQRYSPVYSSYPSYFMGKLYTASAVRERPHCRPRYL